MAEKVSKAVLLSLFKARCEHTARKKSFSPFRKQAARSDSKPPVLERIFQCRLHLRTSLRWHFLNTSRVVWRPLLYEAQRCTWRNYLSLLTHFGKATLCQTGKENRITRFPQTYALFQKMLPQPLIWFRSHDVIACRSWPASCAQCLQICVSSSFLSFFCFCFHKSSFPTPTPGPSRFDLYYISQIRSPLQWHNSSWWLDLG